jgi:fatty acid desaturase
MSTSNLAHARDLNDPEFLRQVNELRRIDNVTNWFYLAREYAFIALVIGLTIASYYGLMAMEWSLLWAVPITMVTILCIGASQHRLGAITHEAAHYILFRNRLLNELVSEWFCMFPMLGTTHSYRVQHLGHHQYPNDPDRDPDWAQLRMSGHRFKFPMTRPGFWWHCIIKQLLLPNLLTQYSLARAKFVVDQGEGTPYRMTRHRSATLKLIGATFHLALISVLAAAVWWNEAALLAIAVPALWAVGFATFLFAPQRWFAEYAIRPDVSVRCSTCMRWTFNTLCWTAVAGLTLATGMPWWLFYLVLWVIPLGTSFAFFMILRQLVQHGNADRERFTNTRVFFVNPLIQFSVFPLGQDLHLPHHVFPLVPHFNLKKLHGLLMQTDAYREQAIIVKGYFVPAHRPPEHPTVVELLTHEQGEPAGKKEPPVPVGH